MMAEWRKQVFQVALILGIMLCAQSATSQEKPEQRAVDETVPAHAAVCKSVEGALEKVGPKEQQELLLHLINQSIVFDGAPYVLFDINNDERPRWKICIKVRKVDGVASEKPEPPYVDATVPALFGVSTECGKDAPGPAMCKQFLAKVLLDRRLRAIGAPRVTDLRKGDATLIKMWVPHSIAQ